MLLGEAVFLNYVADITSRLKQMLVLPLKINLPVGIQRQNIVGITPKFFEKQPL